jgi:putative ABC transport system permease protein
LPYANADRVFTFVQQNGSGTMCCLPYGNFDVWRREATSFEAIGAIAGSGPMTLTGQGDPLPVPTTQASAGFWKAMFIPPALGRYYTEADDREGAPHVVVISYAMWQNRFGGDRGLVGRNITLNGRPYTVAGVASPQYVLYPPSEKIWVPLAPQSWRLSDFKDHELRVYGLLKPGVPLLVADAATDANRTRLAAENPHSRIRRRVVPSSLVDFVRTASPPLHAGAVPRSSRGNIASLLLARANVPRRDDSRLPARRGGSSLTLIESLLPVGGARSGFSVALAGMRFLVSSPANIPRLMTALNAPVLTLLLAVSSILFGSAIHEAIRFASVARWRPRVARGGA